MKSKILVFVLAFMFILSKTNAQSAQCIENITNVTVHSNGQIYFSTDKTCSVSWCQLNWVGDAKLLDRGYVALLMAKTTGNSVIFEWNSIQNCTSQNQAYASPNFILVQ